MATKETQQPTMRSTDSATATTDRISGARCAIITDIDGTIANIETRLEHALAAAGGTRTEVFWTALFNNDLVASDLPIRTANRVLTRFVEDGFGLFYLTNRPEYMREKTEWWLTEHRFPTGPIYLRPDGMSGREFKHATVARIRDEWDGSVVCGIGDFQSDIDAYENSAVPGLLVERNSESDWERVERVILDLLG